MLSFDSYFKIRETSILNKKGEINDPTYFYIFEIEINHVRKALLPNGVLPNKARSA
jgi:hypothetical protein